MGTNIIAGFYTENADVNHIWRFFSDAAHQWRWERLAFDGTVLERSMSCYPLYDNCVANASGSGYVFVASPASTRPKSTSPRTKRSYMRMPTKGQKQVPKIVAEGQEQKEDTAMDDAGLDASGASLVSE